MEQRRVGRSGLRVSSLGLGTMTWGRDTDEHEAREQLEAFVEAGGTLLDCAASDAGGAAEHVVGSLLGDVVDRRDVVLATKVGMRGAGADRWVDGSRRALLADLDASLARLRTDHVDLLLLHAPSDAPVEESLSALAEAQRSGRARYVGVANHGAWELARAATLAQGGEALLVADEVEYSLVARWPDPDLVEAADAVGAGLLAWSPLGRGVLTGKYRRSTPADSRAASPHLVDFVSPHLDQQARGIVEAVCTAADGLDRAPLEVALAWVTGRPAVAGAVVGARTAAQLRTALLSVDLVLPPELRGALDDVSAARTQRPAWPVRRTP